MERLLKKIILASILIATGITGLLVSVWYYIFGETQSIEVTFIVFLGLFTVVGLWLVTGYWRYEEDRRVAEFMRELHGAFNWALVGAVVFIIVFVVAPLVYYMVTVPVNPTTAWNIVKDGLLEPHATTIVIGFAIFWAILYDLLYHKTRQKR